MLDFHSVFSFGANTAPSKKQKIIIEKLESFSKDEDGIATVWAIFWLIICFALSGLAIDVTNAWKVHAILQSTADSSALAGSYELQNPGKTDEFIAGEVKFQANKYATLNMHETRYGDVLDDSDIQLGYWDEDASIFSKMEVDDPRGQANAVYVITRQSGTNGTSGVGTFFLRFAGFREFTVATESIANIFTSQCAYDGLIAEGKVILSTKQRFLGEYCVHGEQGIDMANDNYFGPETIASSKDRETCGQSDPKCYDSSNPGIEDAYMEQSLFGSHLVDINGTPDDTSDDVPITDPVTGEPILYGKVANIQNYYDSLVLNGNEYTAPQPGADIDGDGLPDFENKIFVTKDSPFNVLDLKEDVVNIINCPDKGGPDAYNVTLQLDEADIEDPRYSATVVNGVLDLNGIVIVGNQCDFTFDGTVTYKNATIITNATGNKTFQGNAGTVIGYDDNEINPADPDDVTCSSGNEVTLITMGSVHFAAKLEAYDVEIIAADDVHFAGRVDDNIHVGTSVTAGGDIHLTTNHQFIACDGMTSSAFDPIKSWKLVW